MSNIIEQSVAALKELMAQNGVNVADIGRAGVPEQTVYQVLRGKNTTLKTIEKIFRAAGGTVQISFVNTEPQEDVTDELQLPGIQS